MALHADILAVQKVFKNTKLRQGNVFIIADAEDAAATIGRIKQTNIAFEPVESEADSTGRTSLMGYNVVATAVMTQTDEQVDLAAVAEMGYPSTGSDGQNGFKLLFSNVPMTTAEAYAAFALATASTTPLDGFGLINAIIVPSPVIDFSGGESMVTLTIKGTVPATELGVMADFGLLTFDA